MTAPSRPTRLRWLVVLIPAVVVAILEELSDTFLDPSVPFPLDNLAVTSAVLLIGSAFAWFAFRRIDQLTGALRARNAELEARSAAAQALNRVSVAIAAETGIEHVLRAVVAYARELLEVDVAMLLLEGADGRLTLRASDGLTSGDRGAPAAAGTVTDGPSASSRPVGLPDTRAGDDVNTPDADAILAFVDPARAVARLAAPLQRGGSTIGVLTVGSAAVRGFGVDEVETLASLANQAVIAIEHDRLEARLRELAVADERERIARELHDGIAQVLGYVNTKSQAVAGYLEAGRVDDARAQLAELGSAARAVYVDVRESIIGLRGPIEPGQGLGTALAAHARRVAEASRFGLELAIDSASERLRLDPDAEANVYRIVQEALTNVRKHASAGRVRLAVGVEAGVLTVSVADDGRGFPGVSVTDKPGYGLRAMRERATRVGATFAAVNRPEGGAEVRVSLPLAGHEPAAPDAHEPLEGHAPAAPERNEPAEPERNEPAAPVAHEPAAPGAAEPAAPASASIPSRAD